MIRLLQLARGPMLPQLLGMQQAALSASVDLASSTGLSSPDLQQRRSSSSTSTALPPPPSNPGMLLGHRRQPLLSAPSASLLSAAVAAANATRQAGAAAGPPIEPGRDVWAEMRAAGSPDNRHSLGSGYYSLIIVFGFAALIHDVYAFPPRILAMMGLVTLIMYTRRG